MKLQNSLFLPLFLVVAMLPARAQIEGAPKRIDYQGTVLDSNGNPLAPATPTNYTMQFRIYDNQSGGNRIWSESQTVTVSNGAFSVRLGQGIAIPAEPSPADLSTVFNGRDRFLGLTVVIPGQTPGEVTPRLAFLSSPYSFAAERSRVADSVSQATGSSTLGTTTITNLTVAGPARVNGANTFEFGAGIVGKELNAGKIGYGTFTPNTLDIVGAGSNPVGADRKIKIWSEGGLSVAGPLSVSGNQTIPPPYNLSFGAGMRQMLNLWNAEYGLGIQSNTLYSRAGSRFSWFLGGGHNDAENNPGGGTSIATLTGAGLVLSGSLNAANGAFSGNLSIGSTTSQLALNHFGWGNVTASLRSRTGDDYLIYGMRPDGSNMLWIEREGNMGIAGNFNANAVNASGNLSVGGAVNPGGTLNIGGTSGRVNVNSGFFGSQTMQVRGAAGDVIILGLHNSAGSEIFQFWANGSAGKPGGGSWAGVSDARLKTNVRNLDGALAKLLELRSVTFDFKDPKKYGAGRQTGFIAQEVEKVFPQWVTEGTDKNKMISITGFESLAVQALRELREEKEQQIAARDNEIADLRKQLAKVTEREELREQRLARLERMLLPPANKDGSAIELADTPSLPAAPVPTLLKPSARAPEPTREPAKLTPSSVK